jgi:hypothetical protein
MPGLRYKLTAGSNRNATKSGSKVFRLPPPGTINAPRHGSKVIAAGSFFMFL